MQKTDFIILWHSTVHNKNITILTFKSQKRCVEETGYTQADK